MWIDVNNELPKTYDDVLVYWAEYITARSGKRVILENYAVGYYDGDCWMGYECHNLPVTHWQPLPSAPTECKPSKPQTARTCGTCKNWERGSCNLPRSPRFTDTTSATDGCTPNKKARADWI